MFGLVIANADTLSEDEKKRYKAVYCGLCRSLRRRHGRLARFALNYDMVFLLLVLGSLYEPIECGGCERCTAHPIKKHNFITSELSDFTADMTVALTYLNLLDNWHDDRNLISLLGAQCLKRKYKKIALDYPRQCKAMTDCVEKLSVLEKSGDPSPDSGAKLFGALMAELFAWKDDRWSGTLRAMATPLGEFIYIMDAVLDLERDEKKRRYNPLLALKHGGRDDEFFRELLTVLIGEAAVEFEKLPLVEDAGIMRNILYSGVWTKYELYRLKKARRKEKHADGK